LMVSKFKSDFEPPANESENAKQNK